MVVRTTLAAGLEVKAASGMMENVSTSTAKIENQARGRCIGLVGSFFNGRNQHTRGRWEAQLGRRETMSAYAPIVGRWRCMASAVTSVYLRPEPVLNRTTRSLGLR